MQDTLFALIQARIIQTALNGDLNLFRVGADISAYAKQIQVAIQSRLYDASLYQGKQCVLHISLAPDGSLKSITSEGGDPALCQAALMATKTAKIPKPPSQAVYEKIKDAKLDFKL